MSATGKSTLACLLQQDFSMDSNDLEVFYIFWAVIYDHLEPYTSILNRLSGRTSHTDWPNVNGLLIIDETQASYRSSLWNDLIKFLETEFGFKIALFPSYLSVTLQLQSSEA